MFYVDNICPPSVTTQVTFGGANGTSNNWDMYRRTRNIGRVEPVNQAGFANTNQVKFVDREEVKALAQQRKSAEDTLANQKVELLTAEVEKSQLNGKAKKIKRTHIQARSAA